MKYKAVIFDLFGTLVDNFSFDENKRVLSEMAAALSVSCDDFIRLWNETSPMRTVGDHATIEATLEFICDRLNSPCGIDRIRAAVALRFDFRRRTLTPRCDALETLTGLKAAGLGIGLITNCSPDVPILWRDTPFASAFGAAIFSSSVKLRKPDARIYQLACEQLAVKPRDCLYIGDGSSRELTGASAVGMEAVLIRVPYEEKVHESLRPDEEQEWQGTKISGLKEVLALLD